MHQIPRNPLPDLGSVALRTSRFLIFYIVVFAVAIEVAVRRVVVRLNAILRLLFKFSAVRVGALSCKHCARRRIRQRQRKDISHFCSQVWKYSETEASKPELAKTARGFVAPYSSRESEGASRCEYSTNLVSTTSSPFSIFRSV